MLVDPQTAWQCEAAVSKGNDRTFIRLTGTVRNRASAQLPHDIRRTEFLLANRLALSSPFPNPSSHAITTHLSPDLIRRTGGLELGERVTLVGWPFPASKKSPEISKAVG